MEIIVPAAGISSRFPGMRPKYLLRDINGEMMIKKSIEPYMNYKITVGILQDHVSIFNAKSELEKEFQNKIKIVVIPKLSKGPADTVFQIINIGKISQDSPILIKDCDSYFQHKILDGNYVAITRAEDHKILLKLASKSFIVTNEQGIVTDIIEKRVISDKFCVGGYKFDSVKLFIDNYKKISKNTEELFVSHVIEECLSRGHIFVENLVTDYYDVGTLEEWEKFNKDLNSQMPKQLIL